MKNVISTFAIAATLVSGQAFAAPAKHASCIDAWKAVFVDGDMTGREALQNGAALIGAGVAGKGAVKLSSSVGTAAKVAILLGTAGGVVALSNLDSSEQYAAIAQIKKEALIGGGGYLSEFADRLIEEGRASNAQQVEDAINAITDIELKALCTRDSNPVIFGRYFELVIGKLKR